MDTIPTEIIRTLEEKGDWVWSGELCRIIHELTLHKEAIIERRCREMRNAGKIEASYAQVNGEGPKYVRYRLKPEQTCLFELSTVPHCQ